MQRIRSKKKCCYLGIIDELSVIPVAGSNIGSLNCDSSRPGGAAACARRSVEPHTSKAVLRRLTTTVGDNIEGGSRDALDTAILCCERVISLGALHGRAIIAHLEASLGEWEYVRQTGCQTC
jgi:hypothetical protein